jgi:hypothetical protein
LSKCWADYKLDHVTQAKRTDPQLSEQQQQQLRAVAAKTATGTAGRETQSSKLHEAHQTQSMHLNSRQSTGVSSHYLYRDVA